MFYGRIGFYYLTNIYCSKFPTSELTGLILTIVILGTNRMKNMVKCLNNLNEGNIEGKEGCLHVSLISLL